MYVYMRLPKIWAHGIYRYIVGVEVLDLTHINFRKVGFQYKYIVTVKACNCCRPGQDDYTGVYIYCPAQSTGFAQAITARIDTGRLKPRSPGTSSLPEATLSGSQSKHNRAPCTTAPLHASIGFEPHASLYTRSLTPNFTMSWYQDEQ